MRLCLTRQRLRSRMRAAETLPSGLRKAEDTSKVRGSSGVVVGRYAAKGLRGSRGIRPLSKDAENGVQTWSPLICAQHT